ncbi:Uncharacterized protein GBIM_08536 [Gryllus bimaculatus]|nr:Uncharacterized protein GBIM_08536 [Gryllus bimaculatus]
MGATKSTIHRIIQGVSVAIAFLREEFITFPQRVEEINRELNFYGIARFPKAIGAMGCTHIRISSPGIRLKNIFPVIVATAVVHIILREQEEQDPPDDPDLVLPVPWAQLLMEGQIAVQPDRRGAANDAAQQSLITNYFESLL